MNLANQITILRILLAPVFLGCLLYWKDASAHGLFAAVIFSIACLTDALDGFLSRRLNQVTRLGSMIDPLADKILLVTAYLGMTFLPNLPPEAHLPVWLTLAVISRDFILIAGAMTIYALQARFEPRTNFLGKATTFFQMVSVLCALWALPRDIRIVVDAAACVLTVLSGFAYLRIGARMLSGTPVEPASADPTARNKRERI